MVDVFMEDNWLCLHPHQSCVFTGSSLSWSQSCRGCHGFTPMESVGSSLLVKVSINHSQQIAHLTA